MPRGIWNQDWLSQNSQRNYPLAHDASRRDTTGDFELPTDFIVELQLPVSVGLDVEPERFLVRHIGSFASGYSVLVGYCTSLGAYVEVATALINRLTHVENTVYALGGIGDFAESVGTVTIGKLDAINEQPAGFFTFELAGGRLDVDAIRPNIRGVSAIVVVNGSSRSEPIYGDIELVAGTNMQLVPELVSGQRPKILFNAVSGEGLTETCVCDGDETIEPIRTINGIPPTIDGDFTLVGSSCLNILGLNNGLRLIDTCSDPCCGCPEQTEIAARLTELGSRLGTLENWMSRLDSSVTTTNNIILGAKLNDKSCFSC